ncbi:MAG: c-type cytochrome [Anaerolineae bacterium]
MQLLRRPRPVGLALLAGLITVAFWQVLVSAQGPTPEQLEAGARLYAENCAVCHGASGEGRIGAELSRDWPSIRPDLRVKTVIEEGVSGSPMPAWSQENGGPLTDEEIEALTLYILSWETGGLPELLPTPTFTPRPPITPVPAVEGDPNRGAVLYGENCAVCHGLEGGGRVGVALAKNWPAIRPDLRVKSVIERGVPGSPMLAWSQSNGGPLTDQDINDIVAFILSWPASSQPLEALPTPTPGRAPSIFSGVLGALVVVIGVLVLIAVAVIGALSQRK